jgi:hypothetical protein
MSYHKLQRIEKGNYAVISPEMGQTGHSIEKQGNKWVCLNIDDEEYCTGNTKRECFEIFDSMMDED